MHLEKMCDSTYKLYSCINGIRKGRLSVIVVNFYFVPKFVVPMVVDVVC